MDNYFNGGNKNILDYVGLGCSSLGLLMVFIFNIITCSRGDEVLKDDFKFGMSLWIIAVIFGAIIAVAGGVLSFLAAGSVRNLSMIGKISIIVAAVALFLAIVPNVTICSYNCRLQSELNSLRR